MPHFLWCEGECHNASGKGNQAEVEEDCGDDSNDVLLFVGYGPRPLFKA